MDEVNLSLLNIEPFHFQKGYITQVVQNNNWQLIDKLFSPLKRVKLNLKKKNHRYIWCPDPLSPAVAPPPDKTL